MTVFQPFNLRTSVRSARVQQEVQRVEEVRRTEAKYAEAANRMHEDNSRNGTF